ncbi:MAG: hypothetical protein LBR25_05660 [Erysipelotrichaceae bacterium]|jgi:hypothetical protein|nr:hypothetical protein [Erysipelotrichaceae bacterium]
MTNILFSPVGRTDPIKNHRDGPMLHCVRQIKPDKVYLFLTKEMITREEQTNVFKKSILHVKPDCEIEEIKRPNIGDPSDESLFYSEYLACLQEIINDYPDDKIHVNTTSGTPQMIVALQLCLITLEDSNIEALQIKWDEPKVTKEELIDTGILIKENKDNTETKNRLHTLKLKDIKKVFLEQQLIQMIDWYDYLAAFKLIEAHLDLIEEKARLLIEHAYYRSLPDEEEAKRTARELGLYQELYTDADGEVSSIIEYFLLTKLKCKRKELPDFFIRIKPLAEEIGRYLFFKIEPEWKKLIRQKEHLPNAYFLRKTQTQEMQWLLPIIESGLSGRKYNFGHEINLRVWCCLLNAYRDKYKEYSFEQKNSIQNPFLRNLAIKGIKILGLIDKLSDVRNQAAHQLTPITYKSLYESKILTKGETPDKICKSLEELFLQYFQDQDATISEILDVYNTLNTLIKAEFKATKA